MEKAHLVLAGTIAAVLFSACGRLSDKVAEEPELLISIEDTLIRDTVITDDGLTLVKFRSSWFSKVDSIEVYKQGHLLRAVRLNDGGYVGTHTYLAWTNEQFLCFDFACGSPCWGMHVVDLRSGAPVVERLFTAHSDSVRNTICFWDTTAHDPMFATYRLESLVTGKSTSLNVPLIEPVATPAGLLDSTWTTHDTLFLRRSDGLVVDVDMRPIL